MKPTKKLISLFLSVLMIFSCVTVNASALGSDGEAASPFSYVIGKFSAIIESMERLVRETFNLYGVRITLSEAVDEFESVYIPKTCVGSLIFTHAGSWAVYEFDVHKTGVYEAQAFITDSTKLNNYVNIDVGTDLNTLAFKAQAEDCWQKMGNSLLMIPHRYEFSTYYLEEGTTYYIRVFYARDYEGSDILVNSVKLSYKEDGTEAKSSAISDNKGYEVYNCDFSKEDILPFYTHPGVDPSYAKTKDDYLEVHFDQEALDADDNRSRRGCEYVCSAQMVKEGWYGFEFYLPEETFSIVDTHTIIAQIFQRDPNFESWAGNFQIKNDGLSMQYHQNKEAGASASGTYTLAVAEELPFDKWIPIVIHFVASKENKGLIEIWCGDDMLKAVPTAAVYDINFGWGKWNEDDTIDNSVGTTVAERNYISAKFGMYCSDGGDRTIRMDNLTVLNGTTDNAFELVNPVM